MSDEELHLMEVRVTLELPTDLFTEYHGLKSKRKLTDHIQTAVIDYEERRKDGSSGGSDRVEDALVNLTEIMNRLAASQEADRVSRDRMVEMMEDRISRNERSMQTMFEKMLERVEKIESSPRVGVQEPVVQKAETNTGMSNEQMMQMMQMFANGMGGNGVNNATTASEVVVEEKAPSAPNKKSLSRLNAMMDV